MNRKRGDESLYRRPRLDISDLVMLKAMALVERKTVTQILRAAVRERFRNRWPLRGCGSAENDDLERY